MKLDIELLGYVILFVLMFAVGVNTYNSYSSYYEQQAAIEEQARLEAIPTEEWFVVHDIYVPDTVVGEDFFIYVDREIRQNFDGAYNVQLRHFPTNVNACTASAETPYLADVELDNPVVWSWWAFPQCENYRPGAGDYRVHTQWEVDTGESGVRIVSKVSNVFTVHEEAPSSIQEELEQKLEVLEEQVEELENNR